MPCILARVAEHEPHCIRSSPQHQCRAPATPYLHIHCYATSRSPPWPGIIMPLGQARPSVCLPITARRRCVGCVERVDPCGTRKPGIHPPTVSRLLSLSPPPHTAHRYVAPRRCCNVSAGRPGLGCQAGRAGAVGLDCPEALHCRVLQCAYLISPVPSPCPSKAGAAGIAGMPSP